MVSLTDSDTAPRKKEMVNIEQRRISGENASISYHYPSINIKFVTTCNFLLLLLDREASLLLSFAPFHGILW